MNHFAERRARVLDALDGAMMVLPAAPQLYHSRDVEVPYRPDSELYYLTGCTEPEAVAVFAPEASEGPFILFVRPLDREAERWGGRRVGPDRARELFGADAVYAIDELEDRLGTLLQGPRTLYYRIGTGSRTDGLASAALRFARARGARRGSGPRTLMDPGVILDEMRIIKDAVEIEALRLAASISVEAFRTAIRSVSPGSGEWEIQALLDGGFRARGADGPAFETIVGSGVNGCVLHYVTNGRRIEDGDLVLLDAGATMGMYSADITRTVPANGRFTVTQREVFDLVDSARVAAVEACRPGNSSTDIHDVVLAVLSAGLLDMGALTGTTEEVVKSGAIRTFFPHQTSHWLGVDVHDVGDYVVDGEPRVLEPGMVLTIEPGLYFMPEACPPEVPEKVVGLGIRLEDDILITEDEPDVLTRGLPVSAGDIEDMMA
jgi:Xaa-Pro aminopeptidase